MSPKIAVLLFLIGICALTSPVAASEVQLPAVYPLVNILLPLLNNVYNLLLSLLSIFDSLPPQVCSLIPVDLNALETSLLKLYSQALAIVNFLRSLPEYALGANPKSPCSFHGLLTSLISAITDLTDEVLIGIGGALLPGLLQLVLMLCLWQSERSIMLNNIQCTFGAIYYCDLVDNAKTFRSFKQFCYKYYWSQQPA